jgi:hypothetical protein
MICLLPWPPSPKKQPHIECESWPMHELIKCLNQDNKTNITNKHTRQKQHYVPFWRFVCLHFRTWWGCWEWLLFLAWCFALTSQIPLLPCQGMLVQVCRGSLAEVACCLSQYNIWLTWALHFLSKNGNENGNTYLISFFRLSIVGGLGKARHKPCIYFSLYVRSEVALHFSSSSLLCYP